MPTTLLTADAQGYLAAARTLRSGELIALVSAPGFDSNLFVNGISARDYSGLREDRNLPLFNRAVQGQYPPGSTVKPIFGLAGLEYGVITPEFTFLTVQAERRR